MTDNSSLDELVAFRLQQASEALKEAEILSLASLRRGAVNRAYYAMLYAVMALAIKKKVETSKHSGLISFYDREFVKTGILSRESSRALHLACDRRQAADYGEIDTVDEEMTSTALKDAVEFVEQVRKILSRS